MAKQLGFYFNSTACTGCKACQVACKDKNRLPLGMKFRRVVSYGGGGWTQQGDFMIPSVFAYSVSTACMHCENPPCMANCPAGAISKRADGIVLINQDQCIGCRFCQWACPYGAPQFNEAKGVMSKCNMCEDLLAQGESPACVAICPMRALEVGELSELRSKYGTEASVEPFPDAKISLPALVVTPHRNAQASGKGTGRILNLSEEL